MQDKASAKTQYLSMAQIRGKGDKNDDGPGLSCMVPGIVHDADSVGPKTRAPLIGKCAPHSSLQVDLDPQLLYSKRPESVEWSWFLR